MCHINIEQLVNVEDYRDSFDLIISDADNYLFVQKIMSIKQMYMVEILDVGLYCWPNWLMRKYKMGGL